MNRKALCDFTHNAKNFLTVDNTTYKQWVFRYTFLELEKDLGSKGDITTSSVFHDEHKNVSAKIIARSSGVLSGVEEVKYFLVDSDPRFRPNVKGEFDIRFNFKDGDKFKSGDVLMEISGDLYNVLAVERTVLNLLIRMSSVSTFTRKIVDMVSDYDVLIAPTRKTLWGLLDKRAVLMGGGGSHRINLADAILVKDTHLNILGRDFEKVFQRIADSDVDCRFIEIETESVSEVVFAGKTFSEFIDSKKISEIGVILMDNMSSEDVSKALELAKKECIYENLLFEASGNICEKNVVEYAKTGVDIISMGCLTGGVASVDLGMEVE